MKIPIFPGKYHQNDGFSWAMLVSGRGYQTPGDPALRLPGRPFSMERCERSKSGIIAWTLQMSYLGSSFLAFPDRPTCRNIHLEVGFEDETLEEVGRPSKFSKFFVVNMFNYGGKKHTYIYIYRNAPRTPVKKIEKVHDWKLQQHQFSKWFAISGLHDFAWWYLRSASYLLFAHRNWHESNWIEDISPHNQFLSITRLLLGDRMVCIFLQIKIQQTG